MDTVIQKSSHGITQVSIDAKLLTERIIFIEGEINPEMAASVAKQVMLLAKEDNEKPIKVMISSPGGEITSGMFIYDVITSCGVPVYTYCMGYAYSMAAVLFAAGTKRYMTENGVLMLHEPLLGNRVSGNASTIQSISQSLLDSKAKLCRVLSKATGKTEEEISEATSYDHYFSAKEAVDFSLADEIIPFSIIYGG